MYMFPPFPLLSKVIQKLRSIQEGKVILIVPLLPSQPWYPHFLRLCVAHPRFSQFRRDLLSQQGYVLNGKSDHLQAWRLSCSTTKQQDFRERSLGSPQLREDPPQIECMMTGGYTHGLSHKTIKRYRSCLGSVLSHTSMVPAVQAKSISDVIMSMELQRPRWTPVLPQLDLGIVLEALSKPPYEPLSEPSLKHLTLVFLLAMFQLEDGVIFKPECLICCTYNSNLRELVSCYILHQSLCVKIEP